MAKPIQSPPPISPISAPRWATRNEAMAYARIGHSTLNSLMRSGQIKARKLGVKVLIDLNSVDELFESLPGLEAAI